MTTDAIKRRIKALRERTTARGCTEAEAMEAAAKAAQLMRDHGLNASDLVMTEASIGTRTPVASPKALLWNTIATCANCRALVSERRMATGRDITFFGREPGPQIAAYLFEVCENAIKHELSKFRAGDFYQRRRSAKTKRKAVDDFTLGLVQRLAVRLRALFAQSKSGAALLEAEAYLDRRHPHTGTVKQKAHKPRFDEAEHAGWQAGERVNLSHGVDGASSAPRLIGVRS
ncbi:DUF2786 domain-containing protein [Agrobacterium sp. O3.4]|uniref:DUF2786 domain-containing protein n=1 Tax=Agrobacterium cucumeris TaxID=2862866 RepID=A0ABY8RSR7_9HYPH|nr:MULTISPECIES: DUF2786 domain-containing protein [Rhizobium/Agrobacterium group]MCZ7469030.1 DUF2786 domain-containing protein [Rhizobium rhizogenes]WHO10273.1 DUF2786 domain-containing protein [Agrobacterium cucumeris]